MKTLDEIEIGEEVTIAKIEHEPAIRRRLLDLGFVKHGSVVPVLDSPGKGMRAYIVKGCKIALRKEESKSIFVILKGDEHAV